MLCGNKRVAYTRVPAQHVLYSLVEEERGKDSGRMQTLFLRVRRRLGLSNNQKVVCVWFSWTHDAYIIGSITTTTTSSYLLGHIEQDFSTLFCIASSPLSVFYQIQYCPLVGQHSYISVCLVFSFLALFPKVMCRFISFSPHMANKSESPFLQSVSYFWQVSIELYVGDMSCPWYI